jgi:hypothetical protein
MADLPQGAVARGEARFVGIPQLRRHARVGACNEEAGESEMFKPLTDWHPFGNIKSGPAAWAIDRP